MSLPVTSVAAGILGIAFFFLSYRVTVFRRRHRTGIGMGTEAALQRSVRVHGNFAEYVPFALLLMALAEGQGAAPWLVAALGSLLVLGRGLHAVGLTNSSGVSRPRYWGTVCTFLAILLGSGLVASMGIRALLPS